MGKKAAAKKTAQPTHDSEGLAHIAEPLRGLAVELAGLADDPRNARTHSEANLAAIRSSLARYGQQKPIVVNANTGAIVAGHGTAAAARQLGWTHIAASRVALSDEEARGYGLADNRTAELAEWDLQLLTELAAELQAADAALFDDLLLGDLVDAADGGGSAGSAEASDASPQQSDDDMTLRFQIVVECADEDDQSHLLERFAEEGRKCRPLIS